MSQHGCAPKSKRGATHPGAGMLRPASPELLRGGTPDPRSSGSPSVGPGLPVGGRGAVTAPHQPLPGSSGRTPLVRSRGRSVVPLPGPPPRAGTGWRAGTPRPGT